MSISKKSGQALLEYLIIFAFMSLIAVGMIKGLSGIMFDSTGRIGYILSKHLSVGVCPNDCLLNNFVNKTEAN